MRNLNLTFLLICTLFLTIFTSCSEEDEVDNEVATALSGTITAKVDGNTFTSLGISSFVVISEINGATTFQISGSNTEAQSILISVFDYNGEGTYPIEINDSPLINIANYSEIIVDLNNPLNSIPNLWAAPYEDDADISGFITVSEDTESTVVGTFEFKAISSDASSTVDITSGAFNLNK